MRFLHGLRFFLHEIDNKGCIFILFIGKCCKFVGSRSLRVGCGCLYFRLGNRGRLGCVVSDGVLRHRRNRCRLVGALVPGIVFQCFPHN